MRIAAPATFTPGRAWPAWSTTPPTASSTSWLSTPPDRLGRHVRDRQALLARLADCGVRVEVMGPSPLAKAAAVLANVVLADMIGEAAR